LYQLIHKYVYLPDVISRCYKNFQIWHICDCLGQFKELVEGYYQGLKLI